MDPPTGREESRRWLLGTRNRRLSLSEVAVTATKRKGNNMSRKLTIRSNNTQAYILQTQVAFLVAVACVALGTWYLEEPRWVRGFFGLAQLFLVSATFTLAKTMRDEHETRRIMEELEEEEMTSPRPLPAMPTYTPQGPPQQGR